MLPCDAAAPCLSTWSHKAVGGLRRLPTWTLSMCATNALQTSQTQCRWRMPERASSYAQDVQPVSFGVSPPAAVAVTATCGACIMWSIAACSPNSSSRLGSRSPGARQIMCPSRPVAAACWSACSPRHATPSDQTPLCLPAFRAEGDQGLGEAGGQASVACLAKFWGKFYAGAPGPPA